MNEKIKSISNDIYKVLVAQSDVLGAIIVQQQIVRTAVTSKNWNQLQDSVNIVNHLTKEFIELEAKRSSECAKLNPNNPDDIFTIATKVNPELKSGILGMFHQVRQKLVVSKIENDAINEYIRITQDFLQEVFDNVLPQRRNKLYSSKGKVIKNRPKSVILDAIV